MNSTRGKNLKNIFYIGIIIATLFLYKNIAQTETQTGNINVNMNVVASSTPPGGGPSVSVPFIYDVRSSTTMTSAKIVWKVNDYGYGLNTTSVTYSIDYFFANTAPAIVSGTEFIADISGLQSDTVYNFRILARNNSFVDAVPVQSQFKTQKGNVLNSLTILAKPEKRVPKTGGNFGATASLIFYDTVSNTILMSTSTILSSSGTTTIYNVEVPLITNSAVILKTNAHLAKRLNGVNTNVTDLTLDFTENGIVYLLAGDMAGDLQNPTAQNPFTQFLQSVHQDEFVDILDISSVVSKFNDQTAGERANLNGDSIVDAQDISVVLGNWNKEGDIIVK